MAKPRFKSTHAQKVTNKKQQTAQQAPTPDNTPYNPNAMSDFLNMTDQELADMVRDAKGADMPNMLADAKDFTQEFVFTAGLNGKPQVLDDAEFDQYMKDHNISQNEILSRQVMGTSYTNNDGTKINMSPDRISRMLKYSRLNYIGGKKGGQLYGAGTYFEQNGGGSTGYGTGKTINAVLTDKARVISDRQLSQQASSFAKSHPKFAQAVGGYNNSYSGGRNNMSVWALAMGYNVITDSAGYYNVIDREAIAYRKDDSY